MARAARHVHTGPKDHSCPSPYSVPETARWLQPGTTGERLPQLKPWVKRVFLTYLLLTLPVLALFLVLFAVRAPGILTMTFDSYVQQGGAFAQAFSNGNVVGMALSAMQMIMLALLVLGIAYMFYSLGRQLIGGIWNLGRRRLQVA